MESFYWNTDNPHVFRIGGRDFQIVKRGKEYARQTGAIMSWLGVHGGAALARYQEQTSGDTGDAPVDTLSFLGKALGAVLEEDAVIDLGAILLGSEKEFAEEHFDIGWVINALELVWTGQPGIRYAVRRFSGRFFGRRDPAPSENNGTDSSTESAVLMVGETKTSTKPSKRTDQTGP